MCMECVLADFFNSCTRPVKAKMSKVNPTIGHVGREFEGSAVIVNMETKPAALNLSGKFRAHD